MNHNQKTLCFVGTALVVGMISFFAQPSSPGVEPNKELNTELYPEFDDPLAVTSLEILKYDEDSFAISDFNLTQVDGVWSITSHENYPADAKDQIADAASSVMDLTILGIATDNASEHELFGVVEPDKEKINVGATGVGTRVTMKHEGTVLARMIIGKKVPDKDELRYVRKAGQDRVYTVKVDSGKLSTKFEDWIEKDLLKLDAFKLNRVTLNDYAIVNVRDSSGRPAKIVQERSAMTFAYDNSKWNLESLKQPNDEKNLVTVQLAQDEEPNTTTLNDLKTALDDLKIVNVERKPKLLAAIFKSGKPLQPPDRDGTNSLIDRGFFPQVQDGKLQIYSDSGEVFAGMNDGVEYVLYFGNIAGGGVSVSQDDTDKDDTDKDEQKNETESKDNFDDEKDDDKDKKEEFGLNRYILVSVRFNADLVPKPELKPLPPVEAQKPAEQKSESSTDTKKSTDQSKDRSEKNEASAESQKSQADEKSENGDSDESADEKKSSSEDEAKKKADEEQAKQEAERKKIEEENQQAQDDYEKKLKAGQESVRKLNFRFSDWYFVISEDVYKKIHLSKDDVLKKKDEKEEDSGSGDLPSSLNNIPSNFNLQNFNPTPK